MTLLAALGVYGPGTGSAAAAGCENSWASSAGGSWFDAAGWSRDKVPEPGEGVCIEAPGTYTVSVPAATASIGSLTLDSASGTATLALAGDCAGSAVLSTASGLLVGPGGSVRMGGDGCSEDAAIEGPVLNVGRIVTLTGGGGERRLRGDVTNDGTVAIDADTELGEVGTTFENAGRLELRQMLHVSEHTDVRNESGAIVAAGAGELLQSGGKFFEGAGAISGLQPVVLDGSDLIYVGDGQGGIVVRGDSAISATPHRGRFIFPGRSQTLQLQGTCSEPASITAPPFTNRGTIALEAGCSAVTLGLGGGTIENRGTIDAAGAGPLSLEGRLANASTVAVAAGATLDVASGFAQSARGLYATTVDGPASYGALATPGEADLDGVLSVSTAPGASLQDGQRLRVLRSGTLDGTFRRVGHARLRAGLLYEPLYTAEGVALQLGG